MRRNRETVIGSEADLEKMGSQRLGQVGSEGREQSRGGGGAPGIWGSPAWREKLA